MPPLLDVIVRTLAEPQRSRSLFRALDSIQNESGVTARPIVVVNGQRFDDATLQALKRRSGVLLHQEQIASTGRSLVAGRNLVSAPFFTYLDDDDELIAGSLAEPLQWLNSHPDCDVLISNGYFVKDGAVLRELTRIPNHARRPTMGLFDECWLTPGACFFRTETIPCRMLSPHWNNMEWTQLAFELCAERKRLHFMNVPTMYYHDTPGSMSKGPRHHEAARDLLVLLRQDTRLDTDVRRAADRKYLRVLHNLAMTYWREGRHFRAWRCHLGSLRPPYTLKYLLFTRKLMWPFRSSDA